MSNIWNFFGWGKHQPIAGKLPVGQPPREANIAGSSGFGPSSNSAMVLPEVGAPSSKVASQGSFHANAQPLDINAVVGRTQSKPSSSVGDPGFLKSLSQTEVKTAIGHCSDVSRLLASKMHKNVVLDHLLAQLVQAVSLGDPAFEVAVLEELLLLHLDLENKFHYPNLIIEKLLRTACHSHAGAEYILQAIPFLIKQGRALLDPSRRFTTVRQLEVSNLYFCSSPHSEWLEGVIEVLSCMGFELQHSDSSFQLLEDHIPDTVTSLKLIADLMLLQVELQRQFPKPGVSTETIDAAAEECDICGKSATVLCTGEGCKGKMLCDLCNSRWHQHKQRQNHSVGSCASLPARADDCHNRLPLASAPSQVKSSRMQTSGNSSATRLSWPVSSGESVHPVSAMSTKSLVNGLHNAVESISADISDIECIQDDALRLQEAKRCLDVTTSRIKSLSDSLSFRDSFIVHRELINCRRRKDRLEDLIKKCTFQVGCGIVPLRTDLLALSNDDVGTVSNSNHSRQLSSEAVSNIQHYHDSVHSPGLLTKTRLEKQIDLKQISPSSSSGVQDLEKSKAGRMQRSTERCAEVTDTAVIDQLRSAERAGVSADVVLHQLLRSAVGRRVDFAVIDWPMLLRAIADAAQLADKVASFLTTKEICAAFIQCQSDSNQVVQACVANRRQLVQAVHALVSLDGDTAVVDWLIAHGGQSEASAESVASVLRANVLAPFVERIWKPVEREAHSGLPVLLCDLLRDLSVDEERRARAALADCNLKSWARAVNAVKIADGSRGGSGEQAFEAADVVAAVRSCGDVHSSLAYLNQECMTCFGRFPRHDMHQLACATCQVCPGCLREHFEIKIREKTAFDFVCPVCSKPDIVNDRASAQEHFNFLNMLLRELLKPDMFEMFQKKLRDWNLFHDPKFRWCAHCSGGFVYDGNPERRPRTMCPDCGKSMCFKCRKPWEDQHEGISCERFTQWKEENDPKIQAEGIAKHLEENGIDCPKCNFRFSLAKGGCIHFTCMQCKHQFCAGCRGTFDHTCRRLPDCIKKNLHCHHPRNCLYYMRDNSIEQLRELLATKKVVASSDLTAHQADLQRQQGGQLSCKVMEQKETSDGLRDEPCGKASSDGQAGLCQTHYKEYLVQLANKANIDPVVLMKSDELALVIERVGIPVPPRSSLETAEQYDARLREYVTKEIPLEPLGSIHF